MKSTTFVILWTILFVLFGFYVNNKLYDFTEGYKDNISVLEKSIENEDWEKAQKKLIQYLRVGIKKKTIGTKF
ncbi:DUF4363 family protein [Clostridioides difficile]|uniref:DUF4363 family protein n=1 Tax=Clostridioides difficile TaxID=1496 RepID=UPI001F20BB96|nr:DUF4363 family protein [Clostridioides difficile]